MSKDMGSKFPTGATGEDETLDRAAAALRDSQADGPSPQLLATTLAALREAEGGGGRRMVAGVGASGGTLALAAAAVAVAVAVGGAAVYLALEMGRPKVFVHPNPSPPAPTRVDEGNVATGKGMPPESPSTAPSVPESTAPHLVENRPPEREAPPAPSVVAAANWSIAGTVRYNGVPPERRPIDMSAVKACAAHHPGGAYEESVIVTDGKLANVVVSVRPGEGQALAPTEPPTVPAVMDQKDCQYHPHVLAMRVGQPLLVRNSDDFLHNVHALAVDNPGFNVGQPSIDPGKQVGTMKAPEVFKVKCDLHPWMMAYVHVIEHPFFAVTKQDGTFTLPAGLPDGRYALVAWHERLGEKQVVVEVKGGKAEGADFAFAAE